MRDYRIACATYNGKLVSGQVQDVLSDSSEHLSAWLAPSLAHPAPPRTENDVRSNDPTEANEGAPDLVAVGFQEMIPLVSSRVPPGGRRSSEGTGFELS